MQVSHNTQQTDPIAGQSPKSHLCELSILNFFTPTRHSADCANSVVVIVAVVVIGELGRASLLPRLQSLATMTDRAALGRPLVCGCRSAIRERKSCHFASERTSGDKENKPAHCFADRPFIIRPTAHCYITAKGFSLSIWLARVDLRRAALTSGMRQEGA